MYRQAVAHAPSTLVSHAPILTWVMPHQHGASTRRMSRLADDVATLPQLLQERGYATASFNGGIQLDAIYGLDRGFDVYKSVHPGGAPTDTLGGPENRTSVVVEQARAQLDARSVMSGAAIRPSDHHIERLRALGYLE